MREKQRVLAQNKKATHDYRIIDKYEAGLILKGAEVKLFKDHKVSLAGSFVKIIDREAFLVGATVGTRDGVPSTRDIKLLLNRREIDEIEASIARAGLTAVVLKAYIPEGARRVKAEIATASGKKNHDKRASLREKAAKKEQSYDRQ